ncbi:protein of unknown function [Burkholderia multivorans]
MNAEVKMVNSVCQKAQGQQIEGASQITAAEADSAQPRVLGTVQQHPLGLQEHLSWALAKRNRHSE